MPVIETYPALRATFGNAELERFEPTVPITATNVQDAISQAASAAAPITPIVANIAALRALTSAFVASYIQLASYSAAVNAAPDGGGGLFAYVPGDTTSADNSATIIVDASSRRWYRVWDGVHFQAAWAGIFPSNADNGALISRVPKYSECWFQAGVYTFATYPSQNDFSNVFWRGFSYAFYCTGLLTPDFDQTKIAFDWTYIPTTPPYGGAYAAGGSTSDMATAGISPLEGCGIVSQLDGASGVGLRLGGPFSSYPENYYGRPRGFSVGGFYINVGYTVPVNCFLTGCENVVVKRGQIGFYWNENATGESNSGENLTLLDCNMNGLQNDGYEFFAAQRWTLDGCSLTYNHRMGYSSNQYTVFKSCYFETNASNTPNELIAVDGGSTVVFDQGTSMLGLPFSSADLIAFYATNPQLVHKYRVFFKDTAVYDTTNSRLFIISSATVPVRGKVIGFNGINFPYPLAPSVLMQPDWDFSSGGLTFYPGSSGVTNQGVVVHSPQTHAASFTGTATLQLTTMSVSPDEDIFVAFFDKVVGTITSLGGIMTFFTEDGITISTTTLASVASASWTTSVHDWQQPYFQFVTPTGASKMTMTITSAGAGNYYVSELQVYR
jgi:hypothetical protein